MLKFIVLTGTKTVSLLQKLNLLAPFLQIIGLFFYHGIEVLLIFFVEQTNYWIWRVDPAYGISNVGNPENERVLRQGLFLP